MVILKMNIEYHLLIKPMTMVLKHGFQSGTRYLATQLEHIAIQNYGCSKQDWIATISSKIQEALKESVK